MALSNTLLDPQPAARARAPLERWHVALWQATSRAEVMAIVNEFVAQWEEVELAELPDGCRPWRTIGDATEVHFLKHLLTVHDLQRGGDWPLLRTVCSLFRAASVRLAQLGPSGED
jgi:hypothetical protein